MSPLLSAAQSHGFMKRKIIILFLLVLITLVLILFHQESDGFYSGSPLVVSSNGPQEIEIKNSEVFLVEYDRVSKIGILRKNKHASNLYALSSNDDYESCCIRFYIFGAIFYDSDGKYMGWGRRVFKKRRSAMNPYQRL